MKYLKIKTLYLLATTNNHSLIFARPEDDPLKSPVNSIDDTSYADMQTLSSGHLQADFQKRCLGMDENLNQVPGIY